jgi:hypothetical protein
MIEYIEVNGNRYPVRFGFNALREFASITGTTLSELQHLQKNITLDHAIKLVYCGFKDGARKDKMPFSMSVEDIADLLDEDSSILEKAFETFNKQFSGNEKKSRAKAKAAK